jgi:hypothetical protein
MVGMEVSFLQVRMVVIWVTSLFLWWINWPSLAMDPWIYPEYFGVRLDKVKCRTSDYFGTIWCYSIMFASDLDFKGVLSVEQLS